VRRTQRKAKDEERQTRPHLTLTVFAHEPHSSLLGVLSAAVHRSLTLFDSHGLNNIAWAYATLRHDPGAALLDAVATQCGLQVCERVFPPL